MARSGHEYMLLLLSLWKIFLWEAVTIYKKINYVMILPYAMYKHMLKKRDTLYIFDKIHIISLIS